MPQTSVTPLPIDELTRTLSAAAEQGRNMLGSSFHTYTAEVVAFFAELAKVDAEAAQEVSKCRAPFDLMLVQQTWLAARAEACLNAGVRMVLGAMQEPEAAAAEA